MSYRRPKYIMLRMGLIALLVAVFVWSYLLFSENYERIEASHNMVDALLQNKTELARKYAAEIDIAQQNLDRTEAFLTDVKGENQKLKEKVKLLDQLNNMEYEISQLREQNAQVQAELLAARHEQELQRKEGFYFNTIQKGRSFLQDFKQRIHDVKKRMGFLRRKEHQKKVAVQQEIDRKESLLGNNGYLVKDGRPMPVDMPDLEKLPGNAKIKVKFVK